MMGAMLRARLHSRLHLCLLLGREFLEERVVRTGTKHREIGVCARGALGEVLKLGLIELACKGHLLQGLPGLLRLESLGAHLRRLGMQDCKDPIALCLAQVQTPQESRTGHHHAVMALPA